ncbi:RpoE-regulated lipoprotein [Cronobacter sakazakii]|uniref:RpoE-regulated lipoprotein n=1 Tax=Cronobacter sakazakii TaxID=28141 RepID=A0A853H5B2_CROSK|nr:RpoE-regulated lipoprotein [Cronobacter sakazakii]NYV41141.1 RpoE-regulated lipoprotein [Cronobacter sakazakii]
MKKLPLLLCGTSLLLGGCSTLTNVNWSKAAPWHWFDGWGSSLEVTEKGVGDITADTPLQEAAISEALGDDYRLRSGMRANGGTIVRYFEAMKENQLALVIDGENGTVSRIDVLDKAIPEDNGVEIGTPFGDLYKKAQGVCQKASAPDDEGVECKAPDSEHISYVFSGEWRGPQELMPPDDTLKGWTLKKIIWRR